MHFLPITSQRSFFNITIFRPTSQYLDQILPRLNWLILTWATHVYYEFSLIDLRKDSIMMLLHVTCKSVHPVFIYLKFS